MSSILNTPGYSVFGSFVFANGINRDICRVEEPLTLGFIMTLGSSVGDMRHLLHGSFSFDFCLYSNRAAPVIWSWHGSLQQLPGADTWQTFWVTQSFQRAGDATNNVWGLLNFRPQISFAINVLGLDQSGSEFAVCPDEHYIMIVD